MMSFQFLEGMIDNFENGIGIWKNYGPQVKVNQQRACGRVNIQSGPRGDHTDGRDLCINVFKKKHIKEHQAQD